MSISARFWVKSVHKQAVSAGAVQRTVELAPVVRASGNPGAEGNVDWAKYTPSGSITMSVSQESAGAWFEERLGKDVAITFADPED